MFSTIGTELTKTNPSMFPPFYVKEHVSIHRWPSRNTHDTDFFEQLTAYSTNENVPVPGKRGIYIHMLLHDVD